MSIFKEKKAQFTMNLSGTKVSFETPTHFHRDFGYPEAFSSIVNIFDSDNYSSGANLFSVFTIYWNYLSGIIIKDNDGTMMMNVTVAKHADKSISINSAKQLQDALPENFKATYNDEKRKVFETGIVDPHDFTVLSFPSGGWLNYRYKIGTSERIAYSFPFSNTHYLTASFELMVSYNDERFLKNANKELQEIMNSFKITPP